MHVMLDHIRAQKLAQVRHIVPGQRHGMLEVLFKRNLHEAMRGHSFWFLMHPWMVLAYLSLIHLVRRMRREHGLVGQFANLACHRMVVLCLELREKIRVSVYFC